MIKRWHTKPYEREMRSNKVEYSTAARLYCTTHDVEVTFCMPEFSSIKIISHRFHVDNNEGKSCIGYDIIIVHDLMVQLGFWDGFKYQVLQRDCDTVPMK